ncbi:MULTISPECIES: HEPN domain-containing protein [Cyanophyceae]|uniref:HEPN domain-containing protein n=1 Tax=Cyanophyceae TaxID=3028117 RepID=UPI00016DCF1C|nr:MULTISPECIES: HEPN domain-containing protein [Cyanophyceae]ACB01014.1 conserved hypothetical protein [Picosynechococcus sp. PCC 7002]SMH58370.1 Uncharacterized protein, contains HEPN domain, UPF0332 family [Picosynechococcus sp. OG1]SMQ86399.1 Uncharacterized protein, contains HEPN domain, UPF0332 family [Synechococcus sp. 7002]
MKPETQKFIRKARESLKASQMLAAGEMYNFAGSRAYYTMFYIAEAFLWEQDMAFSSHAAVIAAFGRDIARRGLVPANFHRYLIDAQDKRTQGDYSIEDNAELSAEDVTKLIEQSQKFIEVAEEKLV